MTLLARLILLIVAALLPATLMMAWHESELHAQRRKALDMVALNQARQINTELDLIMDGARGLLVALAEKTAVVEGRAGECDAVLAHVVARFPDYTALALLDPQGAVRCGGIGRNSVDLADRDYVRLARESKRFAIGTYTEGRFSHQPVLPLALPVLDSDNNVTGLLVATLRLSVLDRRLNERVLPEDTTATITDRNGVILARRPSEPELLGTRAPRQEVVPGTNTPERSAIRAGIDGKRRVLAIDPIERAPDRAFFVGVGLSYESMVGAIDRTTRNELIGIFCAVLLGSVLVAVTWTRSIERPLRRLLGVVARVEHDPDARVGDSGGSREFQRLATAFDTLLDRLQRRASALRDSERQMREVVESTRTAWRAIRSSSSAVIICDARTTDLPVVEVNPAFERITGFTRAEVLGRNCRFMRGDPTQPALAELRRALQARRGCFVQLTNLRQDGTEYTCELRISPVFDEHAQLTHFVGVQNDITARVEAERRLETAKEEAEASSRAKTQFLATMSHELRTPLNAIIGFSEMLQSGVFGPLESHYGEYATDINDAGRHLLVIVNDLLDLARFERGKVVLDLQQTAIVPLVRSCIELVAADAKRRGVTIESDLHSQSVAGPIATCDPTRLRQMLINLLANAIKFTAEGGKVEVRAFHDGSDFVLEVADTGVGMCEDEIRVALEPFGQVESALSRRHEGVGLGLPIAKRLAELHGGTLMVESEPGIGTTIRIRLPAQAASAAAAA